MVSLFLEPKILFCFWLKLRTEKVINRYTETRLVYYTDLFQEVPSKKEVVY